MEFEPLRTERLILRPPRTEDAEALHRLVNDWAVVRMLTKLPFPYPREMMDRWIAGAQRDLNAGQSVHVLITGEEDGREILLGTVGLRRVGRDGAARRSATLGYWVAPRFWGHGVATEAATRVSRWAMANLDIEKLTASVAVDNPASAAVLRRIGFRETGSGTQEFIARGGKHKVTRFTATRADLDAPGDMPTLATQGPATGKPLLLVAACALVDADGRVLIARRPEGKPMAGLWEFPGGKLAPGETPEQALVRELKEELGIDTRTACLAPFAFASHPYERFHLLMPLYLCRRWTGRPTAREGQQLAWVWPAKLPDYPMPDADKPLIPLLREFL